MQYGPDVRTSRSNPHARTHTHACTQTVSSAEMACEWGFTVGLGTCWIYVFWGVLWSMQDSTALNWEGGNSTCKDRRKETIFYCPSGLSQLHWVEYSICFLHWIIFGMLHFLPALLGWEVLHVPYGQKGCILDGLGVTMASTLYTQSSFIGSACDIVVS